MPEEIVEVVFEGTSKGGRKLLVGKDAHGLFVMKMTFDDPESKGTVILSESGYGVGLDVEGIEGSVGCLDLFHPAVGDGGPMLIIDNCDNGDPVGYARLSPEGTRVDFETGVDVIGETDDHQAVYGYPPNRE